jgi:hypothetical protein
MARTQGASVCLVERRRSRLVGRRSDCNELDPVRLRRGRHLEAFFEAPRIRVDRVGGKPARVAVVGEVGDPAPASVVA